MFYQRKYCFRNGIYALVRKEDVYSKYTVNFIDVTNGHGFSMNCESRKSLYHMLRSGVRYLLLERKPALMQGR